MGLEASVLLWIQENLRGEVLNRAFSAFTHLGDHGLLFIVLGLLLLVIPRARKVGLTVLTALLIGALITNVTLKPLVGRIRPWLVVEGLTALVEETDLRSFPSGHTTAAFAFAGAVLCSTPVKRWRALALAVAGLMAFSRLYVGVHYPTDVLAGVVVGLLAGALSWQFWKDKKICKKSSS